MATAISFPVTSRRPHQRLSVERIHSRIPCVYHNIANLMYIREAYSQYYSLIIGALGTREWHISLTGPPGNGKSYFYRYFFQRYRREHPLETIVTAAFAPKGLLVECRVFGPGDETGTLHQQIPESESYIHIYDHAPPWPPEGRMVCFAAQDRQWFKTMSKSPFHQVMYMPAWELTELFNANESLGVGLDPQVVRRRFELFGGDARWCLATTDRFFRNGLDKIRRGVWSITSFPVLVNLFESDLCEEGLVHAKPSKHRTIPFPLNEIYEFASSKILKRIAQRVKEVDHTSSSRFISFIKEKGGRAVKAYFFETQVHSMLFRRFDFDMIRLDAEEPERPVDPQAEENTRQYARGFLNTEGTAPRINLDNVMLLRREYKQFPEEQEVFIGYTIDRIEKTIRFVAIPTSLNYPIPATTIRDAIGRVHIPDFKYQIVFAIPTEMDQKFGAQLITLPASAECMRTAVSGIRGIGARRERQLKAAEIHTCGDLQRAIEQDEPVAVKIRSLLASHMKTFAEPTELIGLTCIPQYKLSIEREY